MAKPTLLFSAIYVLVLLLVMEIGPRVAEGRTCESPSDKYKGYCIHSSNCADICRTEGFTGGECKGSFHRRCMCTKNCA
ncbi:hypothetical protein Nepgr_026290 [Nepenthes gracilis]|uniref:Knottins-like domain-containing protein n=1 Tax=Nepenthes gracilis TaxID=150966 RepID=A0AAD3Y096_NEPGR|nr:hypothetical protein Nepgr_026290 [Nepenthes gracilis]